jgi:hypothetical protein
VRVSGITKPAGPYAVSGLPKVGTLIRPGEAIPVQINYTPTSAVTSASSLSVTGSSGPKATVALTGTGLRPVTKFTASPSVVHFGSVTVGHTATKMIQVTDAGNQPSLVQRSATSGGPFGAPLQVPAGLPLNQGYQLVLPVTFRPVKAGAYSGTYKVTWTDRSGQHSLDVPITGTGVG